MRPAIHPESEAAYNVRAAIPDHPAVFARWRARSADVRARMPLVPDLAYGAGAGEKLDLFPAGPSAPLHVFIHGGYWQALDKSDFSFLAEAWTRAGVAVAIVNYDLCPHVTLDTIVAQMRGALAWLHREGRALGVDVSRMQLSGHSAGGHLVAMLMATDWRLPALPDGRRVIHSAASISGLFDLEPLRFTTLNDKVGLDAAAAVRNSPLLLPPRVAAPLLLAVGGRESAGFHAQSDRLASRWRPALPSVQRLDLADCNHLEAVEQLGRQDSDLFAACLGMLAA